MKNIAVITARSGSKGLKDKNIKQLKGKPLMAYTIEAALESGLFSCVHVSTDSEEYASIARAYGADVPFLRDAELATDTAGTWDTVRAVVEKYAQMGKVFDTVTLLQPTSPLRNAEDIRKAFDVFERKEADSVISVCEVEHSPKICNTLGEEESMTGFINTSLVGRRQELGTYYRINGAIYIQKTHILMNGEDLYGSNAYAYIMSKLHSVDIDDAFDMMVANAAMEFEEKKKKVIIFDIDGTLFDTKEGIVKAFNYALSVMKKDKLAAEEESKIIGPSVRTSFEKIALLEGADIEKATSLYRGYYVDKCIGSSQLYEGARAVLDELYNRGYVLGIATMKTMPQVTRLLDATIGHRYFDVIKAAREDGSISKAQMLEEIKLEFADADYYMIGDTEGDWKASSKAEMQFVYATYGYGAIHSTADISCIDRITDLLTVLA